MDLKFNNDLEIDEFESIPLPDQAPNLASSGVDNPATPGSFKSRTVQTLLSQNQDLMARLTVSLKRNIELEQKLESLEDINQSIQLQMESAKDQSEISSEKLKHVEFEYNKLIEKTSQFEKKFAELYTAYQDKVSVIEKLSYRLHRYIKFRKKIKTKVKPHLRQIKLEAEMKNREYLILQEDLLQKNETIELLKNKLQETVDHIQAMTETYQKDQLEIINYHDTRYQDLQKKYEEIDHLLSKTQSENNLMLKEIEVLKENEASQVNKAIYYERKFTDLELEYNRLIQKHTSEKKNDTQKINLQEIQIQEMSNKLNETHQQNEQLKSENQIMLDQLQSLQIIYQDNFEKNEELKRNLISSDNMNKELSQTLSELRKKNEAVEQKLIAAEEDYKQKLQSFQARFYKKPDPTPSAQPTMNQKELLNKIQNLLSDIQVNQSNSKSQQLLSENGELE